MKKSILVALIALSIASGCASYQALSLNPLSPEFLAHSQESNGVVVTCKAFNSYDCKKYLDRDVIAQGYQPVQIGIQNNSDRTLLFSVNGISLPIVPAEQVAQAVHTSTIGRAAAYGVASLFVWPLIIPAVVDGIKSSQANERLDRDFAIKEAKEEILYAHSRLNSLIFVPIEQYNTNFTLTLIDRGSGNVQVIPVTANE